MLEKIGQWVFFAAAVLTIIVYGLEVASKIWGALKTINHIDNTIVLKVGLIIITVGSGFIYIREKYKDFKKKVTNRRDQLDKLQKFVDSYVHDSAALNRELNKVDIERRQILADIKNYRDGLEGKLEKLEAKCSEKEKEQIGLAGYNPYEKK